MTARGLRSSLPFVVLLSTPVLMWIGSPALAARGPQATQKTALVTVVAPATGPLKALTARDFVVHEDNAVREVTTAELATDPLSISLLVDIAQPPLGVPASTLELRASLANFVKTIKASSPDAEIALTEFGGAAIPTVAFGKPADLDKAIQRLTPEPRASSVMLEALVDASQAVGARPAPRRAIVSVDFNTAEGSTIEPRNVNDALHKSGATIWAVSIYQAGTDATVAPRREGVLHDMTIANGGLHLTAFSAATLESMLQSVANSLLSQYTISFARAGSGTPKSIKGETTAGAKVLFSPWMR